MDNSQLETIAKRGRSSLGAQRTRRRFIIAQREPWYLPDDQIELPGPEALSEQPPKFSFTSFAAPIMILGVVFIYSQMNPDMNMGFLIMMPLMSLAMPVGNFISYLFQKKSYKKMLEEREVVYRNQLTEVRKKIDSLIDQQRKLLEREYPAFPSLLKIAIGRSSRRRLWWRRPADPDFLSLRMGMSEDEPSISVNPPRSIDSKEPLTPIALSMVDEYQRVSQIPKLIDLKEVGSLVVNGISNSIEAGFGLARRLLVDLLVHHSPQDIDLFVFADNDPARKRWAWLKWTPHTQAVLRKDEVSRVAFDTISIDKALEWIISEFNDRTNEEAKRRKRRAPRKAIILLLDDSGGLRQSGDIKELAELGHEAEIYLIFAGGKHWPRECRARIDISSREFTYLETWAGEKNNRRIKGDAEIASLNDCEKISRTLAGLEVSSGKGDSSLPSSVRLFDLLDVPSLVPDILKQNWQRELDNNHLLHLPFGLQGGRKGLQDVELNLLPEDLGGQGAYHTILVGTTGSGKSEFMKSLVLATAFRYSPNDLNFFFMDFKGGAAFNVLKDLPHVVGVVTNLSPELVERGLSAMEAEINRRQKLFADVGVQNIWDYNANHPDKRMPQLLLLLDEFARGLEEFDRLPGMLDTLVRQGRSLGMYLLLANQDVNPAVDKLLNNVGWRIALKVQRQEEMQIIDRSLPIPSRPGQGYLLSTNSDPVEFQAAYAGLPLVGKEADLQEAFKIFKVGMDGRWQLMHSSAAKAPTSAKKRKGPLQNEQDNLITMMKIAEKNVQPARPIYLDPLVENISLEYVFGESVVPKVFTGTWHASEDHPRSLVAPVGFLDSPEECLQQEMEIDFGALDGHIWIVGSAGSGKSMTLETIITSLALTHTPEEINFFILEYGAGQLLKFNKLPHTGVVVRSTDPEELLDKLLKYLDSEMDRRTELRGHEEGSQGNRPALFLVINNFAEMRTNYPDHADGISRYARDGKAVGLHLIVTTNRRIELGRLSFANRIVLQLANRDDYMDLVGKSVVRPAVRAEGRGLWIMDGKVVECQIALPKITLIGKDDLVDVPTICAQMANEWRGAEARQIQVLPEVIPLADLLEKQSDQERESLVIPVGISFESEEMVSPSLLREIPRWLVLGPPRSGKSNFLATVAHTVLESAQEDWLIHYLALRRSPLEWAEQKRVQIAKKQEEILKSLETIVELAEKEENKKMLLLIDDLGGAFEMGKETLATGLNNLAQKTSSMENIFIVATGISDELSMHRMTSLLVRNLRQGRTGISLSNNSNDLDWFGTTVPLRYRRMVFPPGRGFWVNGGKAVLVQSPVDGDITTE